MLSLSHLGTKMIAETLRFTTNLMKGRGRTPSKDQSDTLDSVIASIVPKELHNERHQAGQLWICQMNVV